MRVLGAILVTALFAAESLASRPSLSLSPQNSLSHLRRRALLHRRGGTNSKTLSTKLEDWARETETETETLNLLKSGILKLPINDATETHEGKPDPSLLDACKNGLPGRAFWNIRLEHFPDEVVQIKGYL